METLVESNNCLTEKCIVCDCVVHEKRVAILKKFNVNANVTCLEHSTAQKKVAHQINESKMGYIQVVEAHVGETLRKLVRKGGQATGGPGLNNKGVVYSGAE